MRIRSELETELVSELMASGNSSLFPASRITLLIQNAYDWATQMFPWVDLVKAKCTSSVAGQENYDYPAEFRSMSIARLTMNDISYLRKNFEDYLAYKENNPNSVFKIFGNYQRQFFILPVPTTTGSGNITIWGLTQAAALANASDTTIFTDNKQEANEAIVRKAFSVAIKRIDAKLAVAEETAAFAILQKLYTSEVKGLQRDQRIQHAQFIVPDYFGRNYRSAPGRFFYDPQGGYGY